MKKSLYLNNIQLKAELDRCLGCSSKPCKIACPIKCDPHYFIKKAKENNFKEAATSIYQQNPLGKICGLVCPEHLCMKACIRGKIDFPINIPKVQATIIEKANIKDPIKSTNKIHSHAHIAIIGAGPAGISAAITFAQHGISSTLFEAEPNIGGAINLIPEDRLPKQVIKEEFSYFSNTELIHILTHKKITNPQALLKKGFSHIIITTGEDKPHLLNIMGEEFCIPYQDYLKSPKTYSHFNKIAIIGGGNVAADCALTAKKLGTKEIDIFIRRRSCDMRLSPHQQLELIQEKISINPLCSPIEILQDKNKFSLRVILNKVTESTFKSNPNETHLYTNFDAVIRATGAKSSIQKYDENIFYAGDCKNGSSSVVEALSDGKQVALKIIKSLLK